MIRDYFIRKKIWLTDSPANMIIGLIILLILLFLNYFSFILVWYLISFDYMNGEIEVLLPFSREERKNRFLADFIGGLLLYAIPLLLNIFLTHIYYPASIVFIYPYYTAISFVSFFVFIFHYNVCIRHKKNNGIEKLRIKFQDAKGRQKVCILLCEAAKCLIVINIIYLGCLMAFGLLKAKLDMFMIDNKMAKVISVLLLISCVLAIKEAIRIMGGEDEY